MLPPASQVQGTINISVTCFAGFVQSRSIGPKKQSGLSGSTWALLKPLYPGRSVTAALLFTEAPRLIELPAEAMDDALARLTGA